MTSVSIEASSESDDSLTHHGSNLKPCFKCLQALRGKCLEKCCNSFYEGHIFRFSNVYDDCNYVTVWID